MLVCPLKQTTPQLVLVKHFDWTADIVLRSYVIYITGPKTRRWDLLVAVEMGGGVAENEKEKEQNYSC